LVRETAATFEIDSGGGFGPVAMMQALEAALARRAKTGSCFGLVRDTTHTGAVGRYAQWPAERGSIGITFSAETSPAVTRMYGGGRGIVVQDVTPGGPAAQGGLRGGDAITSVGGKPVTNGDELVAEVSAHHPGDKLRIGYLRNGKAEETSVTVADRQKLFGAQLGTNDEENEEQAPKEGKLGITVKPVPSAASKRLNLQPNQGLLVLDVKPGSFADSIQLGRGDVILEINRQPVGDPETFAKLESGLKSGQDVVFVVRQAGQGREATNTFLGGTLP
jgi:serine protease Do